MMRILLLFVLCFYSIVGFSETNSSIKKIQVSGLHEVSKTKVLDNMKINKDHTMTPDEIKDNTSKLLEMGYFSNIVVSEFNDRIVFKCEENPVVYKIKCFGNRHIDKHIILKQCKKNNIYINHIFNNNSLNLLQDNLEKLYDTFGIYGTIINFSYHFISNNSIILQINIAEGVPKILDNINIIGNKVFSSYKIMSLFKSYPNFFQRHIIHSKKYDSVLFKRDVKKLKHFYYENGYIDFSIVDLKFISLYHDKHIVINVIISEGEKYVLSSCQARGNIENYDYIFKDALKNIKLGTKYNLYDMIDIKDYIQDMFFNLGFLKCKMFIHSIVDKKNKCVDLYFDTDLGERFIINKINIQGNTFTKSTLLYHCLKKISLGQYANLNLIHQGKYDLEDTGYVQHVKVDIKFLPEVLNKVDITYVLQEKNTNSFHINTGYDSDGMNVTLTLKHNNWIGCGIDTVANILCSKRKHDIDFIITHPNTLNDIIFSHRIFYNSLSVPDKKHADTLKKCYGFEENIQFLKFINHVIMMNLNYHQNHSLFSSEIPSKKSYNNCKDGDIASIMTDQSNSKMSMSYVWLYNTIPHVHLPNYGKKAFFQGKVVFNGYNRQFHKESFSFEEYLPILHSVKYILHTQLDGGFEYPYNITTIPHDEDIYINRSNNIRGFVNNSIALQSNHVSKNNNGQSKTHDTDILNKNIGIVGNSFLVGKCDLIIPNFFIFKENYNKFFQTSLFFDIGKIENMIYKDTINHCLNVKNSNFLYNIRASTGMSIVWYSLAGPLNFSYSYPLIYNISDVVKSFQCHMIGI
ncbi:outer membrane protein assembly factor BamA [Buchnera aphidicola]|uniref:outer membrane protein assembly factor BamA n=1 Tax=Buchnera aphidicola TaxID=9 RepID=UPI0034648981